jgi:hypothetical protein
VDLPDWQWRTRKHRAKTLGGGQFITTHKGYSVNTGRVFNQRPCGFEVVGLPDWANLRAFWQKGRARKVSVMPTTQQLSRAAIDEFKAIYQEEFGETLSDDEVQEIALRLLRFFGVLNKPMTDDKTGKDSAHERLL